ncbi:MAG: N-6 DNA methylase [Ignavibacteriaceae bacterium]|nr:N-6 DNA methylase [Ignavibacteriaceae bacterium]
MHETSYIRDTPQSHRKEYGQFFTPVPVARLMLKWIIDDNTQNILDPAFGLGIFYDEIMNLFPDRKIHFSGYEIDNHILDYYNHNGKTSNLVLNKLDYLESDVGLFDGIVCNPPYMRFQKFLKRHNILPKIEDKVGKKLVGYSNISSIFLIKSLQELKINGKLAYIMPFEFLTLVMEKK